MPYNQQSSSWTNKSSSTTYPTTQYPEPVLPLDLELLMGLCRCQGKSGDELLETIPHILALLESSYPGVQVQSDANNNIYITKGEADLYPCMVAHLDTVHSRYKGFDVAVTTDGSLLYAYCDSKEVTYENMPILNSPVQKLQAGTGGDDRCGLYVALHLLRELPYFKCCFVVEEECGGSRGSGACDMSFFDDTSMVLQCDRRGASDWVTSISGATLATRDFLDKLQPLLATHSYKETSGMFTDVANLRRRGLGVCSANMSCGYYEPHTDKEVIHLASLENTLNLCYSAYLLLGHEKQEFVYVAPKPYVAPTSSSSNYGNGAYSKSTKHFYPKDHGFTEVRLAEAYEYMGAYGKTTTWHMWKLEVDGELVIPLTIYSKTEDAYSAYLLKKKEADDKLVAKQNREMKAKIQEWLDTTPEGKTWSHNRHVGKAGGMWVKTLTDTDGQTYEVAFAAKKLDIPYSEGEFQNEFAEELACGISPADIYDYIMEAEAERIALQEAEDKEDAQQATQLRLQLGIGSEREDWDVPGATEYVQRKGGVAIPFNGYGDDYSDSYEVVDATDDQLADVDVPSRIDTVACPHCKSRDSRYLHAYKGEEYFYCDDCGMFSNEEDPDTQDVPGLKLDYSAYKGVDA